MKKLLLTTAFLVLVGTAHATDMARMTAAPNDSAAAEQNCKMVETITFGVNFNNVAVEIGNAEKYLDDRMVEIEAAAKDVGITKFEIQNSSFNVYSNNYNGGCGQPAAPSQYQLNGSVSYSLDDAGKAAELAKMIETKGYNINFNSNAYRQCQ